MDLQELPLILPDLPLFIPENPEKYYIFKLRNDIRAYILKEELDTLLFESTFLGGLIRASNGAHEEFEIWEDYSTFMSIIESVRLNTLIVYTGVNHSYMRALCDKWCITGPITEKLDNILANNNFINDVHGLLTTFECKNCGVGFSIDKNTNTSCKYINKNNTEVCGKHIMYESHREGVLQRIQYFPTEIITLLTT